MLKFSRNPTYTWDKSTDYEHNIVIYKVDNKYIIYSISTINSIDGAPQAVFRYNGTRFLRFHGLAGSGGLKSDPNPYYEV